MLPTSSLASNLLSPKAPQSVGWYSRNAMLSLRVSKPRKTAGKVASLVCKKVSSETSFCFLSIKTPKRWRAGIEADKKHPQKPLPSPQREG